MPGDLHTHSSCSDGSTPIEKLPWLAACAGLDWLAISDHDTNRSVRYAYAHPEQNGVKLIPAVELTAYDYGREHRVHILCYYPDDCEALARHTAVMDKRRYDAVYQSCKELEEICPQFKTEEALEFARDSGTLYKAHVMRVLWQYGLSDGMYNTVYRSLFGLRPVRGKILHTPVYETVDTILNLIQECRGVAVLAHPSVYHSMPLARELIAAGRLDGVEIELGVDYLARKAELDKLADQIVYTGPVDAYFDYKLGALQYRSVRFETEVLDTDNYQGNAVVNYTDAETPYTRIIEHKHFEFGTQPKTVISREYSAEWKKGDEPYYPVNDDKNSALYAKYKALADAEPHVVFGGRLGEYKYYDMDKVIESALACVAVQMDKINQYKA